MVANLRKVVKNVAIYSKQNDTWLFVDMEYLLELFFNELNSPRYVLYLCAPMYYCCGVSVSSKQRHNQDLRRIFKRARILEFITFNQNTCIAPRRTQRPPSRRSVVLFTSIPVRHANFVFCDLFLLIHT